MDAILDFLKTALDYLEMMIRGVVQLVSLIPQFSQSVGQTVAYMPEFLGPLLGLSLGLTLLFAVIRLI